MAFSGRPETLKSAQARYAARAAETRGFGFRSLDGVDGYLFEVVDGDRRAVFSAGAGTPYALNDARAASLARDKAFCAETLRQAGVPVLPGRMFFITPRWADMRSPGRELDDALAFAASADYPLFCKPLAASNGRYAEIVEDAAAFADYVRRAAAEHFAVLVQPYLRGLEYRVFVLDGRAVFSYRKHAPAVTGDGERTLRQLVAAMPRESDRPAPKARGRDALGRLFLADDAPPPGRIVMLEGPANRSAGGGAVDLRDGASPALERIAVAAADAVGLRLAGVDIFDLSPRADGGDLAVIEVNSNPMIATLEDHGRWDLIVEIWSANIDAALR